MNIPVIQTVCGYGCGTSLVLRMNIESIAEANGVEISAFCGDVGSCLANQCDAIFISKELAERIEGRTSVPVISIDNLMNKREVEGKVLDYLNSLEAEREE